MRATQLFFATAAITAVTLLVPGCGGRSSPHQSAVLWAQSPHGGVDERGSIGRAEINGAGANGRFVVGARAPGGVALGGRYVYWANYSTGTIGRSTIDGRDVDERFIEAGGAYSVIGVAVDDQHVYWTDDGIDNGWIGRANLDGSSIDHQFIKAGDYPIGLAVFGGHIYWTHRDLHAPKTGCCWWLSWSIGLANVDGSAVQRRFIDIPNAIDGVAVDGHYIFWSNIGEHAIGRAKIDGTEIVQRCIPLNIRPLENVSEGVATDGHYVYWSNYPADSIGRVHLDGSNVEEHFIDVKGAPEGIAVATAASSGSGSCPASRPPLLMGPTGQVAGPYADGWGEVAPAIISNGGAAASGTISEIHWISWGGRVAVGRGLHPEYTPNGGYYAKPLVMEVRASDVRRCKPGGRLVYTRFSFREQVKPGGPMARRWAEWASNMCTGFR